ncbi:MAG: hypothetical protein ABI333_12630 [bacterium]
MSPRGITILAAILLGGGVAQARPRVQPRRPDPVPRPGPVPRPVSALTRIQPIEDPGGKGLRHVLEQLSCLKQGKRPRLVRIAHYGDSIVAGDRVSSGARQVLQAAFGDAGHGFFLLRAPSRWYHRAGVKVWRSKFWRSASMLHHFIKSGRYGYGGVMNWTYATGAWVRLTPQKEGKVGGRFSRLQVYFERRPRGGWLRLRQGRLELGRIDISGKTRRAAEGAFHFIETAKPVTLEVGKGGVRIFGVALERSGPGVVWDGLGLVSARYTTLATLPAGHWRRELLRRGAALVVIQYGANISDKRTLNERFYRRAVARILRRLQPLRSKVSCLVVGPVDRGFSWRHKKPSRPIVGRIIAAQREAALAHGCAFWDSRAAQGGEGAARRWFRARPPLIWNDLTHLTPEGATLIGKLLGEALLRSHRAHVRLHPIGACSKAR